jgi:hypothetical protein
MLQCGFVCWFQKRHVHKYTPLILDCVGLQSHSPYFYHQRNSVSCCYSQLSAAMLLKNKPFVTIYSHGISSGCSCFQRLFSLWLNFQLLFCFVFLHFVLHSVLCCLSLRAWWAEEHAATGGIPASLATFNLHPWTLPGGRIVASVCGWTAAQGQNRKTFRQRLKRHWFESQLGSDRITKEASIIFGITLYRELLRNGSSTLQKNQILSLNFFFF